MVSDNPLENFLKRPAVSWNKSAYASLQKAYEHIKESSPASAEKVKEAILSMTRSLPEHPEKYSLDRFEKNNPGNYGLLKNIPTG